MSKQQLTDRKKCVKCRYSFFEMNKFKWCNYLELTGKRRPHDGAKCFGYTVRKECTDELSESDRDITAVH